MPDFLSRHSAGFLLDRGTLNPGRSPYAELFRYYPQKHAALSAVAGRRSFLWAVRSQIGFRHYEMCKPVEWVLRVGVDRILGYVDDEKWMAFLDERFANVDGCFTLKPPTVERFSILLPFPLDPHEILGKRVFRIEKPHKATLIEDTTGTRISA